MIFLFLHNIFLSMAWETGVQSVAESYQRLKKWYLMPPCLILSIIRYGSRVKSTSTPGQSSCTQSYGFKHSYFMIIYSYANVGNEIDITQPGIETHLPGHWPTNFFSVNYTGVFFGFFSFYMEAFKYDNIHVFVLAMETAMVRIMVLLALLLRCFPFK